MQKIILSISAMALLVCTACWDAGESPSAPPDATRTTDDSEQRGHAVDACSAALLAMASLGCPNDGGPWPLERRRTHCDEQLRLVPDDCMIEAEAWYRCLSSTRYICLGSGPDPAGCDTQRTTFDECL